MGEQLYLGADPGVSGGVVVLDSGSRFVAGLCRHEGNANRIARWIEQYRGQVALAAVEQLNVMPWDGAPFAGTLMRSFGVLEGILAALEIPHVEVSPVRWQNSLGISKPARLTSADLEPGKFAEVEDLEQREAKRKASAQRKSKSNLKRALAEQALRRWPGLPLKAQADWALADAAFLAEYGRLLHSGAIQPGARKGRPKAQEAG